jgi:hypothetical protein
MAAASALLTAIGMSRAAAIAAGARGATDAAGLGWVDMGLLWERDDSVQF